MSVNNRLDGFPLDLHRVEDRVVIVASIFEFDTEVRPVRNTLEDAPPTAICHSVCGKIPQRVVVWKASDLSTGKSLAGGFNVISQAVRDDFSRCPIAAANDLFSPMLIGIFQDGGAEAIRCGLVEDLKVDNMLCSGSRIVFESQPSGPSSASLLNVTLDTSHAGLDIFDGTITATNLKKSRSVPDESIRVYGGNLIVSVFTLEGHEGTAAANPLVVVNGGNVSFDNGIVGLLGDNTNAFRLNGGELRVSNTRFDFGQNRVRPAPVIKVAGGRARICENTAKDGGSGAKNLIEVNNNERHCISDNDAPGWTTACIATGGTSSGIYRDNRT